MKNRQTTIGIKLAALILVSGIFGFSFFSSSLVSRALAAPTSTIRGAAWWGDDNKYLYFNCLDEESGDRLDIEGNLTFPGFRFQVPKCLNGERGVFINPDNNLYGQAWNYNKGLVSFSGTTDPPDGYGITSSKCKNKCNASNSCWACYNEEEKKLYGWAKVDASGEWIRLDSSFPLSENKAPVQLETCASEPKIYNIVNSNPVTALVDPGDFFGVASSTPLGDLFFNCKNDPGSGECLTRNYKVYVSTLTIGSLTAPNFSYAQACNGNALGATLGWCVRSGQQTAYEVVVSEGIDFGTNPTTEQINSAICRSGKKTSDIATSYPLPNYDLNCGSLNYNKDYYWWIRLYDENNNPTQWYQYYGNTINDTDGNRDSNPKTFSTFKHRFPSPYFEWPSGDIKVGSSTEFTSNGVEPSVYYVTGDPSPRICFGSSVCLYHWWSNDDWASFSSTSTATTSIAFALTSATTTVSLKITDGDNYFCSRTSLIQEINYDLPIWREVKAR